jgi:hypothetical protein
MTEQTVYVKFFDQTLPANKESIIQFFQGKGIGVNFLPNDPRAELVRCVMPLNYFQQIFCWALANNETELELFSYQIYGFCGYDTPEDFIIWLVLNNHKSAVEKFLSKKSEEAYCDVMTKAIFVSAYYENHDFTDHLLKYIDHRLRKIEDIERGKHNYCDSDVSSWDEKQVCRKIICTIAKFGTLDQLKSIYGTYCRIMEFATNTISDNPMETFYESIFMSEDLKKIYYVATQQGITFRSCRMLFRSCGIEMACVMGNDKIFDLISSLSWNKSYAFNERTRHCIITREPITSLADKTVKTGADAFRDPRYSVELDTDKPVSMLVCASISGSAHIVKQLLNADVAFTLSDHRLICSFAPESIKDMVTKHILQGLQSQ